MTLPPLTRPARPGAKRSERGSVTPFAVVFVFALLLCLGLVVDGGTKLQAAARAAAIAQAAARAGAGQVATATAYDEGRFVVNRPAALAAARHYLSQAGHPGAVRLQGTRAITVTVTVTRPTVLLSLVGITRVRGQATATARLVPAAGAQP